MTTKEEVFKMLLVCPEGISGQQIAMRLHMTRSAVWKAIQALKKDGCTIEGVTNRGYRLIKASDRLSKSYIAEQSGVEVDVFESVPSTNNIAKEKAAMGAPHGAVIISNTQSSGRGRRGRSFVSGGNGIYMTMILRSQMDLSHAPLVTMAVAVAVRDAIEEVTGKSCGIKWVNDLYLYEKKVCGILTEAVTDMESGTIDSVVTGIGINFCGDSSDFPEELRDIAGFLFGYGEPDITRNDLIVCIIKNILNQTLDLEKRGFLESYRKHSIVPGRRIEYFRGGRLFVATALGIDDNGGLEVLRDDGVFETLSAGEVSIKKK